MSLSGGAGITASTSQFSASTLTLLVLTLATRSLTTHPSVYDKPTCSPLTTHSRPCYFFKLTVGFNLLFHGLISKRPSPNNLVRMCEAGPHTCMPPTTFCSGAPHATLLRCLQIVPAHPKA